MILIRKNTDTDIRTILDEYESKRAIQRISKTLRVPIGFVECSLLSGKSIEVNDFSYQTPQ